MIRGLDVSQVQGIVDWPAVYSSGFRFAYVKCTEGNSGKDPSFDLNVEGARKAGLLVGAYHFAYPLPEDPKHPGRTPEEQVDAFWKASKGLGTALGELPPALDLEWPAPQDVVKWKVVPETARAWGLSFLALAKARWGVAPPLYSYPWWAKWAELGSEPGFADYPLWIADYAKDSNRVPSDGESPVVVPPWKTWTIWQHSGGGLRLPNGVPVDCDVIADEATLFRLARLAA